MADFAYQFWKRVDELRGQTKVKQMCEDLGIKYTRVRDNRSENRYPSKDDMMAIASYLDTTLDYLIRGETNSDSFCEEARYVQNNIEARQLIRAVMEDPSILPLVSALAKKAVPSMVEKNA